MSAPKSIRLSVNGQPVEVPSGTSVAVAVAQATSVFRRSRHGQPRAPLCGMGMCFECRVNIDGRAHVRACMTPARDGMQVRSDD
ncbi:MAG TPA: (2Fe-2S)-binding protein [Rhodanobacteraceae bacterium]